MSEVGDLIDGRYLLERKVGSGGMGIVYLATDTQTSGQVAVKVLRAALDPVHDARARLGREIELLSRLRSPHVAALLGAGYLEDGLPYFVMEFLDGRDLKAELRRRGPLPYAEAAAYLVQTCRGIAVAHRLGIVHRDLKPHNLFVTGLDGIRKVKIVDFGIAKAMDATDPGLTATNTAVGTPLYMSPEQLFDARAISTKADVWALGVILYELLAGFSPFSDDSPGAVVAAVTLDEPVPIDVLRPEVPSGVADAIRAALIKYPDKRLKTAEEFAQLLSPYATPDDQLVVREEMQLTPLAISRPSRTRVSDYLRDQILASLDSNGQKDRATLRCAPASSTQDSHPLPEHLSAAPGQLGPSQGPPTVVATTGRRASPVSSKSDQQPRGQTTFFKLPMLLALTVLVPTGFILQHRNQRDGASSEGSQTARSLPNQRIVSAPIASADSTHAAVSSSPPRGTDGDRLTVTGTGGALRERELPSKPRPLKAIRNSLPTPPIQTAFATHATAIGPIPKHL